MGATWRSLSALCREADWSRPRVLHQLRNGLPYRTYPPGHTVDWHDPNVERSLNVDASTVTLKRGLGVVFAEGEAGFVLGTDTLTVGIEVLPRTDATLGIEPTDAKVPLSSSQWAYDTTRKLMAEKKIPKVLNKVDLARLLAAEAPKAVQAGEIERTLKASYLENQLVAWGISQLAP